jgi:hypothetical protein
MKIIYRENKRIKKSGVDDTPRLRPHFMTYLTKLNET